MTKRSTMTLHKEEFETLKSIYDENFDILSIASSTTDNSEGIFKAHLSLDSQITISTRDSTGMMKTMVLKNLKCLTNDS